MTSITSDLVNKTSDYVEYVIRSQNQDVVALVETWHKEYIPIKRQLSSGFTVVKVRSCHGLLWMLSSRAFNGAFASHPP